MLELCINIDEKEVLRYLGYKEQIIDDNIKLLIKECIEETKKIITPRFIYRYNQIDVLKYGVEVKETNLILKGNDIKNHLKNSEECVLMAVTLGSDIEKKIKLYEKISLTKALILDACATTAIEEVCDYVENMVKEQCIAKDKGITFRYSPGYGDLSLDIQSSFLRVLDAQKTIGLTVSDHNLLFPRKSVTAIIGVIDKELKVKKKSCLECSNYSNCKFRREGDMCGA